jgi:hypothetical protein
MSSSVVTGMAGQTTHELALRAQAPRVRRLQSNQAEGMNHTPPCPHLPRSPDIDSLNLAMGFLALFFSSTTGRHCGIWGKQRAGGCYYRIRHAWLYVTL